MYDAVDTPGLSLDVEIGPAGAVTPQQIVDRSIVAYQPGSLDRPTGLGDAALHHRTPSGEFKPIVEDPAYGRDSANQTRTVRVDIVVRPGGIDVTETTQQPAGRSR